jgi:predicted DNA binding CopG/RHH family protein
MKKDPYKFKPFDKEEAELIHSIEETDDWQPITKDNELAKWDLKTAAKNTLTKNERINVRLTSNDLEGIKLKAARQGIPYQTLISSLIHRYVSGDIQG